ncbi:MAG: PEP-CTERM sorting domain-containing protein [Terracidiphilus sp.]
MKRPRLIQVLTKALLTAFVLAPFAVAVAHADQSMNITYFQIAHADPDGGGLCCSNSSDYVLPGLGINGLPVLNPGGEGGAAAPLDLLGDNEITWWSPTYDSNVTYTGTGIVTLPYANDSFFAVNGTGSLGDGDETYYQAAILSGTLGAPTPETISFTLASDDMAFVYLNGQVVCDDGGVHGVSAVTCTSSVISGNNNTLEVFYVDLDPTGAALEFSVNTADITTSATPEPGTLALFGTGLLGLAGFVRRKIGKSA